MIDDFWLMIANNALFGELYRRLIKRRTVCPQLAQIVGICESLIFRGKHSIRHSTPFYHDGSTFSFLRRGRGQAQTNGGVLGSAVDGFRSSQSFLLHHYQLYTTRARSLRAH